MIPSTPGLVRYPILHRAIQRRSTIQPSPRDPTGSIVDKFAVAAVVLQDLTVTLAVVPARPGQPADRRIGLFRPVFSAVLTTS